MWMTRHGINANPQQSVTIRYTRSSFVTWYSKVYPTTLILFIGDLWKRSWTLLDNVRRVVMVKVKMESKIYFAVYYKHSLRVSCYLVSLWTFFVTLVKFAQYKPSEQLMSSRHMWLYIRWDSTAGRHLTQIVKELCVKPCELIPH